MERKKQQYMQGCKVWWWNKVVRKGGRKKRKEKVNGKNRKEE
jgi:hypothetical protein